MLLLPATAVKVPPVHEEVKFAGVARFIPAGKLSTKPKALAARFVEAELSIVNDRFTISPCKAVATENCLLNIGGGSINNVSVAVPLLPKVEVKSEDVLLLEPNVIELTSS